MVLDPGPHSAPRHSPWNVSTYGPIYFTVTEGQHNNRPTTSFGGICTPLPLPPPGGQGPSSPPYPPSTPTGPFGNPTPSSNHPPPARPRSYRNPHPESRHRGMNSLGPPFDEPEAPADFSQQSRPPPLQTAVRSATRPVVHPEAASGSNTRRRATAESSNGDLGPRTSTRTREATRDAGVSDAVWEELQETKKRLKRQKEAREKKIKEAADRVKRLEEQRRKEEAEAEAFRIQAQQAKDKKERDFLETQRGWAIAEARKVEEERKKRQEELDRLAKAERELQEENARIQEKLKSRGKCVQGWDWVDRGGGRYQCAGGSHYMTAAEAGL